jgi:hypothetical protein
MLFSFFAHDVDPGVYQRPARRACGYLTQPRFFAKFAGSETIGTRATVIP